MVRKVYGHCMPDSEDRARRAIDSEWSDGRGTDGGDHRQTSGLDELAWLACLLLTPYCCPCALDFRCSA
jgi:hypothetical protein